MARDNIIITADDKLYNFILQMFASNDFNEKQMMKWGKKAAANKDCASATTYFTEIIKE